MIKDNHSYADEVRRLQKIVRFSYMMLRVSQLYYGKSASSGTILQLA
jgi:hypothetical protein